MHGGGGRQSNLSRDHCCRETLNWDKTEREGPGVCVCVCVNFSPLDDGVGCDEDARTDDESDNVTRGPHFRSNLNKLIFSCFGRYKTKGAKIKLDENYVIKVLFSTTLKGLSGEMQGGSKMGSNDAY